MRAIRNLAKVPLQIKTTVTKQTGNWILNTEISNASSQPALMVRLKTVREKSGDRILPAYYSDNYIALMPGETRAILTQIDDADTRGERPRIVVDGFNVSEVSEKPAAFVGQ